LSNRSRRRTTLQHKWELQQARADRARRNTRRALLGIAGAVAVVVIVVVVTAIVRHDPKKATATPTPAATGCDWSVIPSSARAKEITDVGTPATTGMPRTGLAHLVITTDRGIIEGDLDLAQAPCAAASLTYLAGKKFFDNTACHRITTGPLYAVYCGDPSGTDQGGPAYRVPDENLPTGQRPAYSAGAIVLVNHGPNTNTSEFGLVYQASDDTAEPTFPVIGKITSGLSLLTQVGSAGAKDQAFQTIAGTSLPGLGGGHPTTPLTVTSVTITPPAA